MNVSVQEILYSFFELFNWCIFIILQVYTQKRVTSEKFKSGIEQFIQKEFPSEETKDVIIGGFL